MKFNLISLSSRFVPKQIWLIFLMVKYVSKNFECSYNLLLTFCLVLYLFATAFCCFGHMDSAYWFSICIFWIYLSFQFGYLLFEFRCSPQPYMASENYYYSNHLAIRLNSLCFQPLGVELLPTIFCASLSKDSLYSCLVILHFDLVLNKSNHKDLSLVIHFHPDFKKMVGSISFLFLIN